jgi:6-phosphogluconate dehydrogenase
VVAFNRSPEPVRELARESAVPAFTLDEAVAQLAPPRVAWVMVPAGDATERMVEELGARLSPGDVLVDGGNTHFKDDVRRARALAARRIHYVDVGTSGGVWGLERGYCLMAGGPREAFTILEPALRTLAPGRGSVEPAPGREGRASTAELGYLHCGPAGAGHFVKMVHNGIEYGVMQAYAEGFDILRGARSEWLPESQRYAIDLADVAELWRRGSVVGSWLLDLTAAALAESPDLAEYEGAVADSGEGRWTVETAIEESVPAGAIAHALFARFRSRRDHAFAEKMLSAMRARFGGHREPR